MCVRVCDIKSRSVRPLLIRTWGKDTKLNSYEFWREVRIVAVLIFGTKFNLRFFFRLRRNVNEFIQIFFLFFERSSSKLRRKTSCVIVLKHVAFFSICAKLTMAFILTSLTLTFHTSVSRCGCGFGFQQKWLH